MKIIKEIQDFNDDMILWRKYIHRQPELAYHETNTAEFVKEKLTEFGIPFHFGLGKTGVVGILEGRKSGEMAIGLRADMDALPIQELNTFEHKSVNEGCMHACGHDGHTTMLLGAAKYLAETKNFKGRVYLIFQPAEEKGAGAKAMIDDGLFQKFPMEEVYGIHNWPGMKLGNFRIKSGGLMAATDKVEICIKSKGCHAAMPEQGIDPIVIGSQIVLALQSIISRNISPLNSALISITQFHGGNAFNVIPSEVVLTGTVRTLDDETRTYVFSRIKEASEGIAKSMRAQAMVTFSNGYPITINHPIQTMHALAAATQVVGEEKVNHEPPLSTMGGEDFSFMLQKKPGCYVFLGNDKVGESSPCMLHSPYYDFNDKILPIGASFFATLVEQRLGYL